MTGLRLFVRGFGSAEVGKKIVDTLENIGFTVKDPWFDGREDTLGGLIETDIADEEELTYTSAPAINDEIAKHLGNKATCWLAWQEFELSDKGTFNKPEKTLAATADA